MNQGNVAPLGDDGVWQDGGLLMQFPSTNQWVGIFLAFQSQAWHTDDQTGHTSNDVPNPGPGPQPGPTEPDHAVRIIGALVNPIGPAPEHETVTLLNASPGAIKLQDWQIADKIKNKVKPGACSRQNDGDSLPPTVQLGNKGRTDHIAR